MYTKKINAFTLLDPLLLVKFLLSLVLLAYSSVPLFPDEAQYWLWSQQLDIGYYSKPPGIAWVIALSCALFQDSEFAIRLPSLLFAWVGAHAVSRGVYELYPDLSVARRAGRLFAFFPLVFYGSFAATTDAGSLAMVCILLSYLVRPTSLARTSQVILTSFLGALFKPNVLLMAPLQLLRYQDRRWFHDALCIAIGCSLALSLPLVWNLRHDWVTFHHIQRQIVSTGTSWNYWAPLKWLLEQSLLLLPVIVLAQKKGPLLTERTQDWHAFFKKVLLVTVPLLALGNLTTRYQANWSVFLYPYLAYYLALQWSPPEKKSVDWLYYSCAPLLLCAGLCVHHLLIPYPSWSFLRRYDIFKQGYGYSQIETILPELKNLDHFIISDTYQSVSELSFYLRPSPVYWFNIHGARRNHFSHKPVPEQWKGGSAWFIKIEPTDDKSAETKLTGYLELLKPYFTQLGCSGVTSLAPDRTLVWIELVDYQGGRPEDPLLF